MNMFWNGGLTMTGDRTRGAFLHVLRAERLGRCVVLLNDANTI